MRVTVTGWRSNHDDWLAAQQSPVQDLPHLTSDQKAAAAKLGISEEDYARSTLAGQLSRRELLAKANRFGELLQVIMQKTHPGAAVCTVELQTFDGKIHIVAVVDHREVRLKVDEGLLDGLLESGSKELEARLARIVEMNLSVTGAARAS